MRRGAIQIGVLAALLAAGAACGGGAGAPPPPAPTRVLVAGSPGSDGVFDPAPMADGSGHLWMSHSIVRPSPNAAALNQVRTRIASSPDGGLTWTDAGVDPNDMADPDFQVPAGTGGTAWVTWRFEVSRLLYDPYDPDASRRWKLLWHRMLALAGGADGLPVIQDGWIGLSTAAAPDGAWSVERKLFAGAAYDAAAVDPFLGPPEQRLDTLYPGASALGGCAVFTEPGMLARPEGIYVSMQCAGTGKLVLLRCDRAFATCGYLGDFITNAEAAPFSPPGLVLDGMAASELVEVAGTVYLIATPYQLSTGAYHGCLVFRVSDLSTASLARSGGKAVLVKRVDGTPGSFNGACGYDAAASGSGILLSEYSSTAPHFRVFATHVTLP